MTYFAIYETASGRLHSIGDVLAAELNPAYTALELPSKPNLKNVMWDEVSKNFIARPPKILADRLEDLQTNPAYEDFRALYASLPQAQRDVLRDAIRRLLGRARYRNQAEAVEI